ncbi:PoNe immunity protein domain-containing protein [Metabacillus malikii]|nr:PoNe immunity protein domain-containing protein [Metabacillus malikii]
MRDTFQDRGYFNRYLDYQNKRIIRFEELLKQLIIEKGTEYKGVRTGKIALVNFYLDKLNALYSIGAPIEEIEELFPTVVKYFTGIWYKEASYSNLLKVVSLAVLLNVSKEQLKDLLHVMKSEEFNDRLIDYLLKYIDSDWECKCSEHRIIYPYGYLQNIIDAKEENEALEMLEVYLEKHWYKGHSDTGWYESHKGNKDIYSGYWSFESGAIAKILQLDDEQLKEVPYYPYDLVHYI